MKRYQYLTLCNFLGHGCLGLVMAGVLAFPSGLAKAADLPVDEAWPMVGTGGHGHTYPGATLPFGFVQASPDTRTEGWDACSGYHYSDSTIMGFSHTHLSGTGCADLADVLVMPVTGGVVLTGESPLKCDRYASEFSHDREHAEPGYYRVMLDKYQIQAEITTTAHAAMHRYTFPATEAAHVLVDLVHGVGNHPEAASLKVESPTVISGHRRSTGWAWNREIYFVIESSQPFTSTALELEGKLLGADQSQADGKNVRACLDFKPLAGRPLLLRVGLSPTSVDEARKNLRTELPAWDFEEVHDAARNAWNDQLSRITVDSPNSEVRQTFYSALYHAMTAPTLYNDADGSYMGPDRKVYPGEGFQNYSTFSLWDTFRAEHPLLTVIEPERVDDFVQTMIHYYQHSPDHALPMWPVGNSETWCMIGYHAVPVIYDAFQKGFHGFEAAAAYQAMYDTAMANRNHQDEFRKYGYVPFTASGQWNQAASRTLEFAFDDWCIARMAAALGRTNDAQQFTGYSKLYRNIFDPKTGFFRARGVNGAFHEPFDPKAVSFDDYTEADAWQYTFAVFHDVPDMIRLYGGNEPFVAKLDQLFDAESDMANPIDDITGLVGQYSHGNEPCHHVAYLYAMAGAQYKTARWVRDIMITQYDNTPEGICGNDDCGQMSAWYVWSAIGLYPLNPASGVYVIGSPIVQKAVIRLDSHFYPGGTFTIIAHDASKQACYIQSAKLNGQPLNRPWITHTELVHGGTLEFQMGLRPNKNWGTDLGAFTGAAK